MSRPALVRHTLRRPNVIYQQGLLVDDVGVRLRIVAQPFENHFGGDLGQVHAIFGTLEPDPTSSTIRACVRADFCSYLS